MKKIRILIALIVSISIMTMTGCSLIEKTPEAVAKEVLVKVNDQKLTREEFNKRVELQIAFYEQYYGYEEGYFDKPENAQYLKSMKESLLEGFADEMLQLQKAEELKLVPAEDALNSEIEKSVKEEIEASGGEEKFNEQLKKMGYTLEDFKKNIRTKTIIEKLYEGTTKDVTVTDEEVSKQYKDNPYDYTEKPNVMNVSHIVVLTEEEAKNIKKEYDSGKSFEELAKQYGTDGTKDKGGLLGDINYNGQGYDPLFVEAALKVPEGKVSDPVKSSSGWHLIKMNKKTEYPLKSFDTVKEDIKSDLLSQKKNENFQTQMTEWKEKASIKIYKNRV